MADENVGVDSLTGCESRESAHKELFPACGHSLFLLHTAGGNSLFLLYPAGGNTLVLLPLAGKQFDLTYIYREETNLYSCFPLLFV